MSRSLADRLRRGARDDEGFGLVEILIAMTIFAIVSISTAPLLLGGLKAGRSAQLNLQGKALAQERLELMRNLPYHVARQNGQYIDVLDIYFRDLQATGTLAANDICDARAYDGTTSTYACTINDLGSDYRNFRQVIRATFLDFQRNTVVPPATYNSQTSGADSPASALLGVAVTTTWTQAGRSSSYTLRSQIANAQTDESTLSAALSAAALTITSNLADGDILKLEGGLVSGEGSLTTGSRASLNATTARAGLASGLSETGAALSLTAPPAAAGSSPSDGSGHMLNGSCGFACFGQTSVSGNQDVTVALGQPQASTASSPVVASLRRTGSNTYRGFSYSNATAAAVDPALKLTGAMVSAGTGSTTEVLNGSGYLDATGTGATAVRSSAGAILPYLELFPTSFAPSGVVQVALTSASLTCASGGGAGSVNATWSGAVRYWTQTGVDSNGLPTGSYVSTTLAPGGSALPDLASMVLKADVTGDGIPDGVAPQDAPLSRWIQAWSALTDPASAVTAAGQRSTGAVSAVVSVLTAPTRGAADETSAINLAVGSLTCHAEDNR